MDNILLHRVISAHDMIKSVINCSNTSSVMINFANKELMLMSFITSPCGLVTQRERLRENKRHKIKLRILKL